MIPTTRSPFSMTCCLRALLEDLSFTKRTLRTTYMRPRVLQSPQRRTITSTPRRMQSFLDEYSEPDFGEAEEGDVSTEYGSITDKAKQLREKKRGDEGEEDVFEIPPGTRLVPESASYFTGNSAFYDTWLELKDLLYKYETLPTVSAADAPKVSWKPLADFRSVAGGSVQSSKYKKVQTILSRLNRIHPELMPEDVKKAIERYRRPNLQELLRQKPKIIDRFGRTRAAGGRKTSSAEAWLVEGEGGCLVNGKPLLEMFPRLHDRESVLWPLKVTNRVDRYNIWASSRGGGISGQAGAITLAVAKALVIHEPLLKPILRRAGCISRDPRTVERKKHGKVKARKMPAWVAR